MQGPKQQPEVKLTPEAEKLLSGAKALHSAASNYKGLKPSTAEKYAFLNLRRLPGECYEHEAGWLFGGRLEGHVHVLVSAGHLPVSGKPAANSPKTFLTAFILQCCADPDWMGFANNLVLDYIAYRAKREPTRTPYFKKLHRERLMNRNK